MGKTSNVRIQSLKIIDLALWYVLTLWSVNGVICLAESVIFSASINEKTP